MSEQEGLLDTYRHRAMATRGVPNAAYGFSTPALALDEDVAALRPAGVSVRML